MKTVVIGIDNGVTGSIGIMSQDMVNFFPTPVKNEQDYTKAKNRISRVDVPALMETFKNLQGAGIVLRAFVERPLVNPGMFKATVSGVRALEATLIVLETLGIGFEFVDSKEWQKVVLPQGIKGSADLKKASVEIGTRLYPSFADAIKKQGDADGLMIAHWAYRNKL